MIKKPTSNWYIPALLLFSAITAILVLIILANSVRVSQVTFLSSLGSPNLTRTRLELGEVVRFETWSHPAGLSYSLWVPFESQSTSGDTLQCRVEAEGWLRKVSRHRDLLDLYCVCERPQLHHDRETSCPGLP